MEEAVALSHWKLLPTHLPLQLPGQHGLQILHWRTHSCPVCGATYESFLSTPQIVPWTSSGSPEREAEASGCRRAPAACSQTRETSDSVRKDRSREKVGCREETSKPDISQMRTSDSSRWLFLKLHTLDNQILDGRPAHCYGCLQLSNFRTS